MEAGGCGPRDGDTVGEVPGARLSEELFDGTPQRPGHRVERVKLDIPPACLNVRPERPSLLGPAGGCRCGGEGQAELEAAGADF
jgi:hypothetical protein